MLKKLDPDDNILGKCIFLIFGDGQRNLATARATPIFYLWRLPAQLGDSLRNAYLFIFGDGQRNLATVRAIC